jgi:hypothetical protein
MSKIIAGLHEFEVVDEIPWGYTIWNIGKNMIDDYLPLVQVGGYDGYQVNINTMKAIKVKDAQIVLNAIGWGTDTVKEMESFQKKYADTFDASKQAQIIRINNALPIMRGIKGIENLK